jgi:hypothetical protein
MLCFSVQLVPILGTAGRKIVDYQQYVLGQKHRVLDVSGSVVPPCGQSAAIKSPEMRRRRRGNSGL